MQKAVIQKFTDLVAWQKAHELALKIYKITNLFTSDEQFGLINQMRRCSTSTKSNLAEGFGRQTKPDKIQFYTIARGSNLELQDQLITARDLSYISEDSYKELEEMAIHVNKLINGLIKSIKG